MPEKNSSPSNTHLRYKLALALMLILLVFTRFLGNHYDSNLHLHPDERWLMMLNNRLHFFDRLDPNFFAYGSLPLYILKATTQGGEFLFQVRLDNYDGALSVGRVLVSLLDITTAIFVFLIVKKISQKKLMPYFALLFYTLMFFPIQNSNFFIVDNFLNFFLTLSIFILIAYLIKPSFAKVILLTVTMSAMLATKVSALVLILPMLMIIYAKQVEEFWPNKRRLWKQITLITQIFILLGLGSFFVFIPYGLLHWSEFVRQVGAQMEMNQNAYIFPYTLQYVGTTAYLYYLKNIFWWGAGPIIASLSLGGLFVMGHKFQLLWQKKASVRHILVDPLLAMTLIYLIYFLVIGRSAVKFMRYLLPIYPFLAILASFSLDYFLSHSKQLNWRWKRLIIMLLLLLSAIWTSAFLKMYFQPQTRVQATRWILNHIPSGSTLAVEHWDDRLPIRGSARYRFVTLPLYELPDDAKKWQLIDGRLNQADYIIIASKRLFVPLMRLNNCQKYRKCYLKTAQYYQRLFKGQLNFKKVATFDYQPILDFGVVRIKLNDNQADESFTVYDHPQVLIFKKINNK